MRIIHQYTFLFQYQQRHFLLFVGSFTAEKSDFGSMFNSQNLNSKLFSNIIKKINLVFIGQKMAFVRKKYFMTKFKDCRFNFFH